MTGIYIALICVGAAILIALFALFCYFSNNALKTTRYTIKSPKVRGKGVNIVLISDLHGKEFGKGNNKLLQAVKAAKPDFIAVTGDIIHKYRERDISVACGIVGGLSKISPTFFVSGNHEMRSVRYKGLKEKLIKAGAIVLDDCSAYMCGVNVHGVNCANIKKGAYAPLLSGEEEGLNILLAHLPQYITRYAACGYDVVLCGHAHGGQFRIPFTDIGIYSPGQGLFPKYTSGAHICGVTTEIISRGLGNSEFPLRIFNPPELVVIRLERE